MPPNRSVITSLTQKRLDMKNFSSVALLLVTLTFLIQCKPEDQPPEEEQGLQYNIEVLSPSAEAKHVGDTIQIEVAFSEAEGGTIHHINLSIYSKDDPTNLIYNQPAEAHVHQLSPYTFSDEFVLNVPEHSNWIFEAKVWGEESEAAEVSQKVEFHVHP